jgi:hypothetical protein
MAALLDKLVAKVCDHRDSVPVFRIQQRSLDEMEGFAIRLAGSLAGEDAGDAKSHVARGQSRSNILLAEGVRASVFHASGAIVAKAALAPMEHLIGDRSDKAALTQSVVAAAKRLGLDRVVGAGEQLLFERLWQIKAAGMDGSGVRSPEVVCRAVGAFRRYLHDLPVWGRASAFVELAGENRIGAVGLDWRPIVAEPFDRVKVIAPEQAARAVLGDLNGRLPGGSFGEEDFDVGLFSLGYLSMPKRHEQSVFAPVYVAQLERRGWSSTNYIIIVGGSETAYESYCRKTSSPPRDAAKPKPGDKPAKPQGGHGWDPMAKPKLCHD